MLNLKFIQENPELVIAKLKKKNFDATNIVNQITELYRQKNQLQNKADQAKAEMNKISGEVGLLMRQGKRKRQKLPKPALPKLKRASNSLILTLLPSRSRFTNFRCNCPTCPPIWFPKAAALPITLR
jgi:seryl-tRNA synthetase